MAGKLGSGLTVCGADFITSKKGLGGWRKGDVPRCAGGGVPEGARRLLRRRRAG